MDSFLRSLKSFLGLKIKLHKNFHGLIDSFLLSHFLVQEKGKDIMIHVRDLVVETPNNNYIIPLQASNKKKNKRIPYILDTNLKGKPTVGFPRQIRTYITPLPPPLSSLLLLPSIPVPFFFKQKNNSDSELKQKTESNRSSFELRFSPLLFGEDPKRNEFASSEAENLCSY